MAFKLDDYVDVAERVRLFNEKFPEGSLQALHKPEVYSIGDKVFILYAAAAYRTPDDARPGIGYAWEPVPGPTPYTRDSEVMNAETAAWGRAIMALGSFPAKKIASSNEVVSAQVKNSLYDLKARAFNKALSEGAEGTAEGVAAHFGVSTDDLQDESVLQRLLDA